MGINQYKIVLVNLDPTVGSEIRKTRPCVIISPDEMNNYLRTIIVVPITAKSKNYPTRLEIVLQRKSSWLAVDQVRTIDKKRVIRSVGQLSSSEISGLKKIISETFVD